MYCFVERCLSFCTFSFGHCVACLSFFDLRILITLLVSSNSSLPILKNTKSRTLQIRKWLKRKFYVPSPVGANCYFIHILFCNNAFVLYHFELKEYERTMNRRGNIYSLIHYHYITKGWRVEMVIRSCISKLYIQWNAKANKKDKQKPTDWSIRTPQKNRGECRCSRRVTCSCYTTGTLNLWPWTRHKLYCNQLDTFLIVFPIMQVHFLNASLLIE